MPVKDPRTKKILIGGGLLGLAGWGIYRMVAKAEPPTYTPPPDSVVVALKNPPPLATFWSMYLTDWNITIPIDFVGRNGKDRLDIDETAIFEIPSGVAFPLRVAGLQLTRWAPGQEGEALEQIYYMQSLHPYLWDFDEMDWGDEPDPSYRDVFIPDYGSYWFDFNIEDFILA